MNTAPLIIAGVAVLGVSAYLVYNQQKTLEQEAVRSESSTFQRKFNRGADCAGEYTVTFDGDTYCLVKKQNNLD